MTMSHTPSSEEVFGLSLMASKPLPSVNVNQRNFQSARGQTHYQYDGLNGVDQFVSIRYRFEYFIVIEGLES